MLAEQIDTVVLGCTHYPFVIPLIQEIVGPSVQVIDPAPAIARQTRRLLEQHGWLAQGAAAGTLRFVTSGPVRPFAKILPRLLGESAPVEGVRWNGSNLPD